MLNKRQLLAILIVFVFALLLLLRPVREGISFLYQLFFSKEIVLRKQDSNLNVLLMGISGGEHEGPELTDTIIFANINLERHEANLISIPRDLWVTDLNAKINTAYASGQGKGKKGITLAKAVVEKVTGNTIDYVVVLDFAGFEKLIDYLSGVDIEVKRTLDDYEYPITGAENELCGHNEEELPLLATASSQLEAFPCRYAHIHFDKGLQHMNSEKALQYVRSRHALGDEGSDFARSQRQHQVIEATRNKVLSLGILLNPIKVFGIYNILKSNINTDIPPESYDDFVKLYRKMQSAKINNYVLDIGDEKEKRNGILINPPFSEEYKYQWVLIPRRGNDDFSEIKEYIDCIGKGNIICSIKKDGIEVSKK